MGRVRHGIDQRLYITVRTVRSTVGRGLPKSKLELVTVNKEGVQGSVDPGCVYHSYRGVFFLESICSTPHSTVQYTVSR